MPSFAKTTTCNTAAIILAAGFGTRLKSIGPKPFLLFQGKSFIELVVEKAETLNLNPMVVVTNRDLFQTIDELDLRLRIVINHQPENGMFSSLKLGMSELNPSCDGFLLCPIDYPLVKKETFQKMLFAHDSSPNHIITPIFNNRSGHPIVFPRNLFDALRDAPVDQGARFVTRQFSHLNHFVKVTDPGILVNINTPALYYQHCK